MKNKKKILYVVEAMGGGIFTYLTELLDGIQDDFEITLAMAIRADTPENYREYFSDKINIIILENMSRNLGALSVIKSIFEIRKIAKEINPDIIHLHSSIAGAVGRIALSGRKYHIMYTPHGYSFLMQDMNSFQKVVFRFVEKLLGRKRYMTVACGKSEWEEGKNIARNNIFISNGVNLKEIDEIKKTIDVDVEPKTIFTLGRIVKQKNPELFNAIAKEFPQHKFVWIGDGKLRDKLTSPNIEITGWMQKKEAIKLSAKYEIFLLTSLWEGLPIALLEAMYMDKICVVSNIVGNRDVVIDGVTGFLCKTKEDFTENLKKIIDDKVDTKKIIRIAHGKVEDDYNNKIFCKKYKKLYLEVSES